MSDKPKADAGLIGPVTQDTFELWEIIDWMFYVGSPNETDEQGEEHPVELAEPEEMESL
jgi:hypothetical protein